ncbi:MAG: ABC transporter permease [Melioribacteraceae bacterium]|nr:ABC transporter permease [Melioribacteraceae bacterium]MCF8266119.1 ABC transporter permease [Melioribacteraceae bacterium]MCF8413610.1 ABC transporter permease [Melioribacteraceae bacterium]MCF8432782.1 ABC transporter permease [Melioribacteraceae bacterium]
MKNYLFELKEGLIISFRAIRANKIRSVLTTLGIIIGVWAVVVMSTAVKGIDQAFQTGVASLGSDNLYIDKWAWFNNDIPWWELRNRENIQMEDFEKFKDLAKLPLAVAPTLMTRQTISQEGNKVEFTLITGTNADYVKTTNLNFEDGRFFSQLESDGARAVCVLGYTVANQLFPMGYPIGQYVKIKGKKVKVVGVLEEQGSWVMGDFNPDNQVYLPIGIIHKYFQNETWGSVTINVRAPNSLMVEDVKEEAIGVMRRVRGLTYDQKNDFSVNQQEGLLTNINETIGVIQIAGYFITGLSLFVGAIGIMNIMFVSVKERTKEIGIRKAIGAKKRAILGQFISESAVICLIGGMLGLLLAIVTSLIINQYLPTTIQEDAVILAVVISLITGILSGFAPAYTAAKMDPVEALRYE